MDQIATYQDVYGLLERTPAASVAWADGITSARLTLVAVQRLIETMVADVGSPLRENEEEVLGDEIRRLNLARGADVEGGVASTKFRIRVKAVLSPSEQTRVCRIVGGFCQPFFETSMRFSKNGHAVMNAVRRVLTGYCNTKVPRGASVVEVGPDVTHWMLSPSPSVWSGSRVEAYQASRPILTPRDGVRMLWAELAANIVEARAVFYDTDVVRKAAVFKRMRAQVFPDEAVPTSHTHGEYMLSYDSNYDIKFSDMPVAMALAGARAWYGTMVRAKGLTSSTHLRDGTLPLMGVNYRVDWDAGRIDFRHPECSAFGYSHDVHEYMKYEERNGYVWSSDDCDYVYSKGPETTDELLFFSVVRVPKLHRMHEPRFTENPRHGMVELQSLWGVGDESNGVPSRFEHVTFHVDALNFSKVLEKRRALDHRGDLAITLSLVRSTNVRFYMHGTPIGVNERVAARLAPATAIVVETMVHEQRLNDNQVFDMAMYQFDLTMASTSWFSRLLASVIDYKVIAGVVVAPIARVWHEMRGTAVDVALRSLSDVRVGARVVEKHVVLPLEDKEKMASFIRPESISECGCGEIAELRAAIAVAGVEQRDILTRYLQQREATNHCALCLVDVLHQVAPVIIDDSDETTQCSEDTSDAGTDETEVTEVSVVGETTIQQRAAQEFIELETYLMRSNLVECRVDYHNILQSGPINDANVLANITNRTRHAMLEFKGGRCVRNIGVKGVYSAAYDPAADKIVSIRTRGDAMSADLRDGVYYTCNRMEVWNAPAIIQAVEYSQAYGKVNVTRAEYNIVLGVPGAGKTYRMMSELARMWKSTRRFSFLVLAVTNESVKAALKYGRKFGIDEAMLDARVMTLDKYLMHKKIPADVVCGDEFPMVHIAKFDAAIAIAAASTVYLYGDARQIPFDPFCKEFRVEHATLGLSVNKSRVTFLPVTHRLTRDTCAMWVDQYPSIYPCDCCNEGEKNAISLSYEVVNDIAHVRNDADVRYHTYLRDDRDELRTHLGMTDTKEMLRARTIGGLSTVHEDQGSTHKHVVSIRLSADYDKNASPRNPSLFNRERYVLTDTTRHKNTYKYITVSEERDLVMKRIDLSKDPQRLKAVDEKVGINNVGVFDMLM